MHDDHEEMRDLHDLRSRVGEQAREAHEHADAAHEHADQAHAEADAADRSAEQADETLEVIDEVIADREGHDELAARRRRRWRRGGGLPVPALAGAVSATGDLQETARSNPAAYAAMRAAIAVTTTVVIAFPGGAGGQQPPSADSPPRATASISRPPLRTTAIDERRSDRPREQKNPGRAKRKPAAPAARIPVVAHAGAVKDRPPVNVNENVAANPRASAATAGTCVVRLRNLDLLCRRGNTPVTR